MTNTLAAPEYKGTSLDLNEALGKTQLMDLRLSYQEVQKLSRLIEESGQPLSKDTARVDIDREVPCTIKDLSHLAATLKAQHTADEATLSAARYIHLPFITSDSIVASPANTKDFVEKVTALSELLHKAAEATERVNRLDACVPTFSAKFKQLSIQEAGFSSEREIETTRVGIDTELKKLKSKFFPGFHKKKIQELSNRLTELKRLPGQQGFIDPFAEICTRYAKDSIEQIPSSASKLHSYVTGHLRNIHTIVAEKAHTLCQKHVEQILQGDAGAYLANRYISEQILPALRHDIARTNSTGYLASGYGIQDPASPLLSNKFITQLTKAVHLVIQHKATGEWFSKNPADIELRDLVKDMPSTLAEKTRAAIYHRRTLVNYLSAAVSADYLTDVGILGREQTVPVSAQNKLHFDSDLWALVKDTGSHYLNIPEQVFERTKHSISQAALSELLQTKVRDENSYGTGSTIYEIQDTASAPFAILNGFRQIGHSGGLAYLSTLGNDGRKTTLGRYICSLTESQVAAIEALQVPGLSSLISLVRTHPRTFHRPSFYFTSNGRDESRNNPIYTEVQKQLSQICLHYLKNGSAAEQSFALGTIQNGIRELSHEMQDALAALYKTTDNKAVQQELLDLIVSSGSAASSVAEIALKELAGSTTIAHKSMSEGQRKETAARMFGSFISGSLPDSVAQSLATIFGYQPDQVKTMHAGLELLVDSKGPFRNRPFAPNNYQDAAPSFQHFLAGFAQPHALQHLTSLLNLGYVFQPEATSAFPYLMENATAICDQLVTLRALGFSTFQPFSGRENNSAYCADPMTCLFLNTNSQDQPTVVTKIQQHFGELPLDFSRGLLGALNADFRPPAKRAADQKCHQAFHGLINASLSSNSNPHIAISVGLAGTFLLEHEFPPSEFEVATEKLLLLGKQFGVDTADLIRTVVSTWPDAASSADSFVSTIDTLTPYFGHLIKDAGDLREICCLIEMQRRMGITRSRKDEVVYACGFAENFGTNYYPKLFLAYTQILDGTQASEELAACGVTLKGKQGVHQLKTFMRNRREQLLKRDGAFAIQSEIDVELLSSITGYTGQEFTLRHQVESYNRDKDANIIAPTPDYLSVGTMHPARIDATALAEFEFSQTTSKRFDILQRDIREAQGKTGDELVKRYLPIMIDGLEKSSRELSTPLSARERNEDKEGKRERGRAIRAKALLDLIENLKRLQETGKANALEVIDRVAGFESSDQVETTHYVRRLVIASALGRVPHSMNLEKMSNAVLSPESLAQVAEFFQEVVLQEALPALGLNKRAAKRVQEMCSTRALTDDLTRLGNLATSGTETWELHPTRGMLAELSGYICSACWLSQHDIMRRHSNITSVIFVREPKTPNEKLGGAVLLIDAKDQEGNKVLVIRGLNPTQNYITRLQAKSFVENFIAWLSPQARAAGYAKIVIPGGVSGGSQTNRPPINQYIGKAYADAPIVPLAGDPPTLFNGYDIQHKCILLRDLRTDRQ